MLKVIVQSSVLFVLSGCTTGEVKIGVEVSPTGTTQSGLGLSNEPSADSSNPDVTLDRVRLLVTEVLLGDHDGLKSEPLVVDLSGSEIASGAQRELTMGTVSTGDYKAPSVVMKPLNPDDANTGHVLALGQEFDDFRTSRRTLIVDGTFQGVPFSFAGHFHAEQRSSSSISVTTETPVSIPFLIEPETWFADEDGEPLDPTNAAHHTAIAEGICRSLNNAPTKADDGKVGDRGRSRGTPCVEPAL